MGSSKSHDPFAALRYKEFLFYLTNRFFLTIGIQLQSVVVGWQVYSITQNVLDLGIIGLAEAIPFIIVSLFSGYVADTYNRKKIILLCLSIYILITGLLVYVSSPEWFDLNKSGTWPIYLAVCGIGIVRGFVAAAYPSFLAQLVPRSAYANAATWNSTIWHIASILGPACAGFLILLGYQLAYFIDIILILIALLAFVFIAARPVPAKEISESLVESLSAGVKFVFKNELLLGALSLDLFAVLFGGAVALLPAFTEELLKCGPNELGLLRAAPALGAVIMALIIAYKPPRQQAGMNLLVSVALFGLATIGFGLSTNFFMAFFFLFLTGAFDNVSVVVRHTILQLSTPDHMRGRVSAVNSIFIGSSNEIGAFESGSTAQLMGLRQAIVLGGSLTLCVVVGIGTLSRKLRQLNIDSL